MIVQHPVATIYILSVILYLFSNGCDFIDYDARIANFITPLQGFGYVGLHTQPDTR